jgi:PAS domain S-box-containing protein
MVMHDEKRTEDLLKMAIEDLEGVERYIKELSSFLPLAVCTINPLGVVLIANSAFQNLTGYREVEIIGEKIEDLFLNKKDFNDLIKSKILEEKKILTQKMILLTKERKRIPVNMAISTRKDEEGNFLGYFMALSDISEFEDLKQGLERKVKERTKDLERRTEEITESRLALMNILEDIEKAKEESEEERDKTLAIFDNFPEGLLFLDKENRISSANPDIRDFFELDPEKIVGKKIDELEKSSLGPFMDILKESSKGIYRKELKLRENLILEISAIPVMRAEEKIGTLIILRDVTREKIIERLKSEFVSIAAHQLRTPLSAVKWTLKMILDGDLGKISDEQREFLGKTYVSNERMIRLINDLLNITRIEEGRFLYNIKKQSIIDVAEKVIVPSKEEAERRGLRFEFQKPRNKIPEIKFDAEKISLVFQNLLDNAIHYTKENGNVKVSIDYLKNKKEIIVSIKDTGIGIVKDQQKRVFSRFFRGANAIKTETEGTGLGLFIAKNIVEAHNGRVWFESKENKGSTFYFSLPAS